MKDNKKLDIENALMGKGITLPTDLCTYHTGTSICQVEHPEYGKHQVTKHQIKFSSAEYKNELYKDIIKTIAMDIDMFGIDDSSYFKLLPSTTKVVVRKLLEPIVTLE